MMRYNFFAILFLVCVSKPHGLVAQGPDEIGFLALTRTLEWTSKLKSHELELSINSVKEVEPNPDLRNAALGGKGGQFYYEQLRIIKSIFDSKSDNFSLAMCEGNSSIDIRTSVDETLGEDNSTSYFAIGISGRTRLFELGGNELALENNGMNVSSFDLLDLSLGSQGLQGYPIRFLHDTSGKEGEIVAAMINFLSSPTATSLVVLNDDKDVDNRAIKTLRFKIRHNDKIVTAYRFVISDEGGDKGFLRELHESNLARENFDKKYEDESILDSKQSSSVVIRWEHIEDQSTNEKIVVPAMVTKNSAFRFAQINSTREIATFKWSNLGKVDVSSISYEKAKDTATKFRKQIDMKFNR